ncbi:3896_t:CDS:2 [Entrophospora sp. SA101]|nr:8445_t:CDS:2 [Entrophospora sp. SA101]CAJ0763822.1 3896_t:CDS:2 [Entrophospora sp. SA101]CAJ0836557.1 11974_t:CDS:2 [Entrophospora sp. SA101]CAJ0855098.1 455_t:CDS:2 [Entrophospora sp. SA101]
MKIFLVILLFLTINVAANGRPGKVLTTYTTNQVVNVQWEITEPLGGTCFVDLSTTRKDGAFKTIRTIPNCADKIGENFQADVQFPKNTTCRYFYLTDQQK